MLKDDPNRGQASSVPKAVGTPDWRLLVVDDEPAALEVLVTSLGQRGFSVVGAADLHSAMHAATTAPLDIILLDVRLGGVDGLELVPLFRAAGLTIPCVVLTGHAGPYDGFKARDLGVASLIEKPSSPDEIAAVLRRTVMGAQAAKIENAPVSGRVVRIGHVLTGLLSSAADVHSMEGLCALAPLGVAPSTFRRWCSDLRINPASAVEFARLLRAIARVATHGMSPSDWLDMDQRTFEKLVDRGGLTELFAARLPSLSEFIRTQQFVRSPLVLSAVERHCLDLENRAGKGRTD